MSVGNAGHVCGSEHLYAMCTESTSSVRLKIVSKHLKKLLKEHCVFTSRNMIYFTEFLLKNSCVFYLVSA